MICSLEKNKLENLEILEEFLVGSEFRSFVKKIMMSISENEYLECEGVIDGNVRILARDFRILAEKYPKLEIEEILGKIRNRYLGVPEND